MFQSLLRTGFPIALCVCGEWFRTIFKWLDLLMNIFNAELYKTANCHISEAVTSSSLLRFWHDIPTRLTYFSVAGLIHFVPLVFQRSKPVVRSHRLNAASPFLAWVWKTHHLLEPVGQGKTNQTSPLPSPNADQSSRPQIVLFIAKTLFKKKIQLWSYSLCHFKVMLQ